MAAIGAATVLVLVVVATRGLNGSGGKTATPETDSALPMAAPTTLPSATGNETSVTGAGGVTSRPVTTTTPGADWVSTVPAATNGLAAPSDRPSLSGRVDCPAVEGSLVADTDGDGCPETLHYSGGILESASARWSVGADGDQVATGDWTCRGETVLAVLHPPTGDVFVFDGWAPADHDLVATAVTRVEGGFAVRAGGVGDGGCPRLVVDRRDGAPVEVPIGAGE